MLSGEPRSDISRWMLLFCVDCRDDDRCPRPVLFVIVDSVSNDYNLHLSGIQEGFLVCCQPSCCFGLVYAFVELVERLLILKGHLGDGIEIELFQTST